MSLWTGRRMLLTRRLFNTLVVANDDTGHVLQSIITDKLSGQ
jgi:hypothetical protein